MPQQIKINIDSIDDKAINGWFINPSMPSDNKVLLVLDGVHKDTTQANLERQDVADAYGQLHSGFYFDLTKHPLFSQLELHSEHNEKLLSFNRKITDKIASEKERVQDHNQQGQDTAQKVKSDESIKFDIDSKDDKAINGWFINTAAPSKNKVLLFLDGTHKETTQAELERQDVADAYGQLHSGFYFDLTKQPPFSLLELRSEQDNVLFQLKKPLDTTKEESSQQVDLKNIQTDESVKISIDSIDDKLLQGWFINSPAPAENKVLLFLDGQYKAITLANIDREDVADSYGQLQSGFCFDITKFPCFHYLELRSEHGKILLSLKLESPLSLPLESLSEYSQDKLQHIEILTIDLSKPINGDNWYGIEPTGRWAGPALESTLTIPALIPENYQIDIDISDDFSGLEELQIIFNDKPLHISGIGKDFPMTLHAEVHITEQLPCWTLNFVFPKTCPPDGESGADQRRLGIFLRSITLTKINA